MKKILNTIFIFVSFFVVFSNSEVKAAKFGGHLINGPRNMLYTVNGGAEDYVVNINTAVYNWMYTGYDNPIYMTAVSSLSGSTVDFYSEYLSNNITARTFFFDSQSQLILIEQLKNQNWLYNEIYVNDKYKYDYSIDHTGTMAHELGHALGLDHNTSNQSIMYGSNQGRVQTPQWIDNEEIVEIYGRY